MASGVASRLVTLTSRSEQKACFYLAPRPPCLLFEGSLDFNNSDSLASAIRSSGVEMLG